MAESPVSPPAALEPTDPLSVLNGAFRDAYAARRDEIREGLGPVIAQIDDVLVLRKGGQRFEGPARTRRYHEFKSITHVPLALHMLLSERRGAPGEALRERLQGIERLITAAVDSLGQRRFTPEEAARQRRILEATRELALQAQAPGGVPPERLTAYARAQAPDLLRNAEDAARDQLETMHATVEGWKRQMTPEEQERLRVVVATSHMARPGNVAMQYFSVTLGETWEGRFEQEDLHPGRRVLSSETSFDEAAAFSLLATHVLDARVGRRFFGEEDRLARDVLADAAERLLAQMFHREPEPPENPDSASGAQPRPESSSKAGQP
jgi:hypothetical protein